MIALAVVFLASSEARLNKGLTEDFGELERTQGDMGRLGVKPFPFAQGARDSVSPSSLCSSWWSAVKRLAFRNSPYGQ